MAKCCRLRLTYNDTKHTHPVEHRKEPREIVTTTIVRVTSTFGGSLFRPHGAPAWIGIQVMKSRIARPRAPKQGGAGPWLARNCVYILLLVGILSGPVLWVYRCVVTPRRGLWDGRQWSVSVLFPSLYRFHVRIRCILAFARENGCLRQLPPKTTCKNASAGFFPLRCYPAPVCVLAMFCPSLIVDPLI